MPTCSLYVFISTAYVTYPSSPVWNGASANAAGNVELVFTGYQPLTEHRLKAKCGLVYSSEITVSFPCTTLNTVGKINEQITLDHDTMVVSPTLLYNNVGVNNCVMNC